MSSGWQSPSSKRKMKLCVRVLVALGLASALAQGEYVVPDAKFEALKPRGLRVSIPGMRIIVLWVIMSYMAPASSTETGTNIYQTTWFHLLEDCTVMIDTIGSFETLIKYLTALHHIPENSGSHNSTLHSLNSAVPPNNRQDSGPAVFCRG